MNIERDKVLTEMIGECYHEFHNDRAFRICDYCNKGYNQTNDFDSWDGLGKLATYCKKQKWWYKFIEYNTYTYTITEFCERTNESIFLDPNKFADAIYEFLQEIQNY